MTIGGWTARLKAAWVTSLGKAVRIWNWLWERTAIVFKYCAREWQKQPLTLTFAIAAFLMGWDAQHDSKRRNRAADEKMKAAELRSERLVLRGDTIDDPGRLTLVLTPMDPDHIRTTGGKLYLVAASQPTESKGVSAKTTIIMDVILLYWAQMLDAECADVLSSDWIKEPAVLAKKNYELSMPMTLDGKYMVGARERTILQLYRLNLRAHLAPSKKPHFTLELQGVGLDKDYPKGTDLQHELLEEWRLEKKRFTDGMRELVGRNKE
jgi:hypothetical protein